MHMSPGLSVVVWDKWAEPMIVDHLMNYEDL